MKIRFLFMAFFVVLMLFFAACDNDTQNNSVNSPAKQPAQKLIPNDLKDTTWTQTAGHKIEFTTDSVKITPKNGTEQTFKLKDIIIVDQINQTTLYFDDDKTEKHIVYRNSKIEMVNFDIITPQTDRVGGWSEGNEPVIAVGARVQFGDFVLEKIAPDSVRPYEQMVIVNYTGPGGHITIPKYYFSYYLRIIGENAFRSKNLTQVTFQSWNYYELINNGAFKDNPGLIKLENITSFYTIGNGTDPFDGDLRNVMYDSQSYGYNTWVRTYNGNNWNGYRVEYN